MVIHFLGDIGQPLHNENLDVGGNDISVEYSGDETNLHHVWDTQIPESVSGGPSLGSARSWAVSLTKGVYLSILLFPLSTGCVACADYILVRLSYSDKIWYLCIPSLWLGERTEHLGCAEHHSELGHRGECLRLLSCARGWYQRRGEQGPERRLYYEGAASCFTADREARLPSS